MALFLILVHELQNVTLRRSLQDDVDIQSIAREILSDIRRGPWTETEEYNVESYGLGVQKLAWSFVSVALAVHALSVWRELLTATDRYRLGRIVRKLVRHHISAGGSYRERAKDDEIADPLMYPTAYVIEALYAWSGEESRW